MNLITTNENLFSRHVTDSIRQQFNYLMEGARTNPEQEADIFYRVNYLIMEADTIHQEGERKARAEKRRRILNLL